MSTGVMEAKWTAASRAAHKAKGGYFAGPDDTYPLKDASDVPDAWGLAGHAAHPDQVRRNIIAWAKANGHTDALPDTAKAFMSGKQEESAAASVASSSIARPAKKIATLRVCFLEYNARSLNGRIYPKATCDLIYQAALRRLSDPNGLPATCFVSHETANSNVNTELVGRVVKVWQEGSKFYADIDLADTRVARDMLALAEGGYLRSESMRVAGVELSHDRNYDLPLVVPQEGFDVQFLGIDLTTRPGLMDSARIHQVLYESFQHDPSYTESFALIDSVFVQKEALSMPVPLFLRVLLEATDTHTPALKQLAEAMTADRAAHQRIHDHLAGVLDSTVKPIHGSESARLVAAVESELSEEGRALAVKHAKRLALAHDEAARQMGMDCNEGYHEALGIYDPDHDGDDDSPGSPYDFDQDGGQPDTAVSSDQDGDESQKGKEKPLTEAEMLAALKAKGYTVEAPKTQEQLFQETLDAKLAEQERKFNERLAALTGTSDPQRQTLALGSGLEESSLQPENLYQEGDYLRGELAPKNWRALADRRVPWPHDKLDAKQAIAEMAPFLAYRLNLEEAAARGRHISQFIDEYEQV